MDIEGRASIESFKTHLKENNIFSEKQLSDETIKSKMEVSASSLNEEYSNN